MIFQEDKRDDRLQKMGSRLDILEALIPWNVFREPLEKMYKKSAQGGRPPYDSVMMFKILVLQTLYNLADDETEYQISDRLSFQKFWDWVGRYAGSTMKFSFHKDRRSRGAQLQRQTGKLKFQIVLGRVHTNGPEEFVNQREVEEGGEQ